MSIESPSPSIFEDPDDPDGIADFLGEYNLNLDNLAMADTLPRPEPRTKAFDRDEVTEFLAEAGVSWGEIESMDFTNLDGQTNKVTQTQAAAIANAASSAKDGDATYSRDNEVPVIDGEAIYEALQTAAIPEISSLGLSQEQTAFLEQIVISPRQVAEARQYIREILRERAHDTNLHINEDVIFQACIGLSEALQNAIRHGGGARRIIMGVTPYGNIFIGIENNMTDNLPHEKTVGKAALGLGLGAENIEEFTDDTHKRGLFLMAVHTVNGLNEQGCAGLQKDRTISAGLSSMSLTDLEKLARFEYAASPQAEQQSEYRRTLSWGVYGYDTEAARIADTKSY